MWKNRFIPRVGHTGNTLGIAMTTERALLDILHLFSPSLPIGAFAFSQGLEAAIESGHVRDAVALETWCDGVLRDSVQTLDCYYLRNAYQARSAVEWAGLNEQILTSRETAELLQEDLLLGSSLNKWAEGQGIDTPDSDENSVVALYGWLARKLEVPEDWAVTGFLWSWLDNQVTVAAKAVPLGQQVLQGVLMSLKPRIFDCVIQSKVTQLDTAFSTVPNLAILSAQHETQYSRLFRS